MLEDAEGGVRRLITMARYGLGVLHAPVAAVSAALLQCLGWLCQLFAVWAAMRAFDIHEPLPAAGLVLVLMNVAMLFPLWPGNVGLVQAAVALPLVSYGVPYAKGFAFGIGLQAIEMSVGVGIGFLFLAREGLSYAMLKRMPGAEQAEVERADEEDEEPVEEAAACARSRRPLAARASCPRSRRRWRCPRGCAAPASKPTSCPSPTEARERPRCFAAALGGEWRTTPASGPARPPVVARFLVRRTGRRSSRRPRPSGCGSLAADELDPLTASSLGLGELLLTIAGESSGAILVGLGDTATVDGGAGLLELVGESLSGRELQVLCDVRNPLLGERGAARAFGPQKGASPEQVEELEARLAGMAELRPYAELPGAGAAGGLGAALASLGGRLLSGADVVLERIGFRGQARTADLVVTGEGTLDRSTTEGKAVGEVREGLPRARRALRALRRPRRGASAGHKPHALSGDPDRAADDLVELGGRLARALLGAA